MNPKDETTQSAEDPRRYAALFPLCLTIFFLLFCLFSAVGFSQKTQIKPQPTPQSVPRRPLPKLPSGARGFDSRKAAKDAAARLIAIGGGWGSGGDEKIPKLKSKTAQGYYKLGNEYVEQLGFCEAISAFEKAVAINPNYFAAYNALGEVYAFEGPLIYGYVEDGCKYDECMCKSSDYFKDTESAGKFEQMRYRQAIQAFEQARRLAPKNPYMHLNLGILYFNTGQYQKAADSLQQGLYFRPKPLDFDNIIPIDFDSTFTAVYGYVGQAYEYLGQNDNAIKFYQKALVVNRNEEKRGKASGITFFNRLQIYQYLGDLYQKLGEPDKALAYYQNFVLERGKLSGASKDTGDVLSSIGTVYAAKQNINKAAVAFGIAINIYEYEFDRYSDLLEKEKEEKDRKIWEEELARLQSKLAQANYNVGVAQLSLNQTGKAIESFKRVVKLDPRNIDAHYNMAVAYLTRGNKMAARIQAHILKDIDSELANDLEELIDRYVIPINLR